MLGLQLEEFGEYQNILLLLTVPLVVGTFMIGPGQLLLARWRWENIYYALTDQRILLRDGQPQPRISSYPVADISGWQQRRFGEQLASIRILRGDAAPLVFACLEYPQNLTQHFSSRESSSAAGDSV